MNRVARAMVLMLLLATLSSEGKPQRSLVFCVSNENSGQLTLVDLAARNVIASIPVGKRPRGLRVVPGGSAVMVAVSGSPASGLAVIDLATRKLARTLPSGADPQTFDL